MNTYLFIVLWFSALHVLSTLQMSWQIIFDDQTLYILSHLLSQCFVSACPI